MVNIGLMPDSIVAYLMKAFRQYMLQISANEFRAFYPGSQPLAAFTVFVAECNMSLVHADHPMIGDGNPKYISSKIV
jgi:hypothetical protein